MITMEFEEMKKVWDSQNNEPLYAINEKALHNRILVKKRQAYHTTNFIELLSIIVNIGVAGFIFAISFYKQSDNIAMYVLSAWAFLTGLYILIARTRRVRSGERFDRSMLGDLQHAISLATYHVRLSNLMRWNIVPVGLITAIGLWQSGKSIWLGFGILIFFALASYGAAWEHRIYRARKRELELLRDKLSE